MKKTFRGLLADGDVQQIRLSTNDGLTGYKILKFQLIPNLPVTSSAAEHVCQVFTTENDETAQPRTASTTVNFDDPTLLGVALWAGSKNPASNVPSPFIDVIFDNMTFNQDIFVTHVDADGDLAVNYYLELEQVKLSKDEATVATLKDMRAGPDTNFGP